MTRKPQGLSPNYYSIVSPQLPQTLIFSWNFIGENNNDRQQSAIVYVYEPGELMYSFSKTVTGDDNEVSLEAELGSLAVDESYEWAVRVKGADGLSMTSERAPFKLVTMQYGEGLAWPDGPDPYEYIGTRRYFEEIRQNALALLDDYVIDSPQEEAAYEIATSLFTGDIVPSKKDFTVIESLLGEISQKENTYRDEILSLIKDGLGAGDLHKIYDIFDRMTRIGPRIPENVYFSFSEPQRLQIDTASATNSGEGDVRIDIKWEPTELQHVNGQVNFMQSRSEDVAFYEIRLEAGFTDYRIPQTLYFRSLDIEMENRMINFELDHVLFADKSSSLKTSYILTAIAYDKRGNPSSPHSEMRAVENVPLGVARYQLRAQKWDLNRQTVKKTYYDIYNGLLKAYVHNVGGNPDGVYQYAVRIQDKNGLYSSFYYLDDFIKVDPLKPPAAPKLRVNATTTSSIEFAWNAVTDAEDYEVDPLYGSAGNSVKKTLTHRLSSLNESTSYSIRVRARNRAGNSAWVSITGKTKAKPIVEYSDKAVTSRCWRTSYRVLYQNGTAASKPARYDVEKDSVEVMHGEWIELRDKYESGAYVRKGTRWGNYKSLLFLDYADWQSRLKGKEIVDVKMYIRRKNTSHGYPDDGRFLHIYTHNYASAGSLPSASTGPAIRDMYKATKLDFDRGQGQWVTLPKLFGEKLRDGKMKGLAFHHPSSTRTPYSYMRLETKTFQLKIRYK